MLYNEYKINFRCYHKIALGTTTATASMLATQSSYAAMRVDSGLPEVMFRASADGGQTFNDKINLSNSSNADSTDAAISAEGGSVTVTWWETNETSQEPLVRTSTDNGVTFGPINNLATNGTIGEVEGTEEGE